LYRHCEESHFKCFICERNNILFNYFRNYKHLEEHFDNKHFLCSDSDCLEKKFVVFRTKFELQAHEVVHLSKRNLSRADQLAARTLQVNFTVRRSTRHGGGLDDSGSSNNNVNVDASNSLAETEQYQALAQQSYQTRSTSQHRAAVSTGGGVARARPVESPVFYPDDRRNRRPERETNYNAADTGFRLSSNTPTDAPKPLNTSSGSIPPANTSSSSSASTATTPTILTPAERTKNLINKIKTFLGDDAKFAEFRRISANFKQGKMTSQQYYQQFQHEFGESAEADKLFEEMVDLLPDSHKQRALWDIHSKTRRMSADFPSLRNNGGGGGGGGGNASWVAAPAARGGRGGGSSAPQRTEAFPALPPASAPEPSLPGHRALPGHHHHNNQPAWPAPPPSLQGQAKPTNKKGKKVLLSYG
jgi:hypothetical protein